MSHRASTRAFVLAAALMLTLSGARSDDAKYPNWKGQWIAIVTPGLIGGQFKFDPTKDRGIGQQAPLTKEYQQVHQDSMDDQANGGLGNYPTARCLPGGMPRMMASQLQEYIITPETTYILLSSSEDPTRRIFTDGRDRPSEIEPTYHGYSIGKWSDQDGDGRFYALEVETRGFKGPRAYDATGLPLHFDNQSIFKERFHLDKDNGNILHDEITVFDHALTRPWSVDKTFRRSTNSHPDWRETVCNEGNSQIVIGEENYLLRANGLLMPAKKDQAPPDLRYFKFQQPQR